MEIVIATGNRGKVRDFRNLLKLSKCNNIELISLLNFPEYISPEETGTTHEENALIKARKAASALKKWVIADDSGLIVPRLQGNPGLYSARYAGPNATDADNRRKLLQDMEGMEGIERSAYCECCIALCGPDGTEKCVTGICEGYIIPNERGRNGSGYDSIFVKNDYDKTFAELDESITNRISHRYKAFEKLLPTLESLKQ